MIKAYRPGCEIFSRHGYSGLILRPPTASEQIARIWLVVGLAINRA